MTEEPLPPKRSLSGPHLLDGSKADAGYPTDGDYVLMYWVRRAREAEAEVKALKARERLVERYALKPTRTVKELQAGLDRARAAIKAGPDAIAAFLSDEP